MEQWQRGLDPFSKEQHSPAGPKRGCRDLRSSRGMSSGQEERSQSSVAVVNPVLSRVRFTSLELGDA